MDELRLVVTGACGFIGSVLCKRAREEGHEVVALDDRSRGLNPVDADDLIEWDCRNGLPDRLWGFDAVAHLAAGTGSLDRPIEELRDLNVKMTQAVYRHAVGRGARAFVFPTTSLALGVPDSPYVVSKEEALRWLVQETDSVPLIPLRLFNVIGEYKSLTERRKHEVHIIPTLVQSHQSHTAFTINGDDYDTADGTPGRDFIHVLDVVDFILGAVYAKLQMKDWFIKESDGVIWVGTSHVTTVSQVVRIFRQQVADLPTAIGPPRPYDVGSLACTKRQAIQVEDVIGRPLTPAWVGIRDEARALLETVRV